MPDTYTRLLTINVEVGLLLITYAQPLIINNSITVKVGSPRLRTYLKGICCVTCGLKATHFAIETDNPKANTGYHLNLYASTADGEIMMTSDHTIPKAKGGSGSVKNRQPMCRPCNLRKGDKLE